MEITKVNEHINSIPNDNIEKLSRLFPSVVKDGEVDFEALKEELGEFREVTREKYELTWAGKKEAKKLSQEDVIGRTLKYSAEKSVNPTMTENIYIEGDNLEVLKLLRQNYYNAIKMIYIDPPYNTGKDFVYRDKFSMSKIEADYYENAISEDGERLVVNPKSGNRYHANWMNNIYSRLLIARDLLTDDGAIFISINDIEQDNLKKICNEIFGERNLIATFCWKTDGNFDNQAKVKTCHEYIFFYAKDESLFPPPPVVDPNVGDESKLNNPYIRNTIIKNGPKNPISTVTIPAGFPADVNNCHISRESVQWPQYSCDIDVENSKLLNSVEATTGWAAKAQLVEFIQNGFNPVLDSKNQETEFVMTKTGAIESIKKRSDSQSHVISVLEGLGGTQKATADLGELGDYFDYPKPIVLLKYLASMVTTNENDIFMDFFSGSGSFGHAIMDLNRSDGMNRRFVLVQYPEKTKADSKAKAAGFDDICQIGRARLKNVCDYIYSEDGLSYGYKTFTASDTNIKWHSLVNNGQLDFTQIESTPDMMDFMPDSKDVDIVYEIMLRQRDVPLSESIDKLSDIGNRTYMYADSYLICLESEITTTMIDKMASIDPVPVKYIFRDSAFKDDIALKDETFRRLKAIIEKNTSQAKQTYTVEFI
ncbi:site-specific DNA-methyltransferase [Butyrivibrio sp. FC2001]|uniref:site-specific DNA-methyltransferase n=1 Tax=Butyrivibrio sp. FC2001 TaxID=1280671 RepID=UPI00041A533F|nr:site-specific DNA-methyltransferase [Butyrivibrio sp. FC2001]